VLPQCVDDDGCRYTFLLERKPKAVRLASRKAIPAELELLSSDQRQLGICIRQIVLHDEYLRSEVSHAHPSLDEGFHADEGGHRWTDGMALLPQALLSPFTGRLIVEVHRHQAALRYPLRPVAARKEPGPNEARPPAQAA
jgi:hypothetical protein